MNKFDNAPINDTVLNGGLLIIAIAWVTLAAIRGPATPTRDDAGTPAATTSPRASDIAGSRPSILPTSAKTATLPHIS